MSIQKSGPSISGLLVYRTLSLLLALVVLAPGLEAQRNRLQKADELYQQGRLRQSIELYRNVLNSEEVPIAKIRLADAYRRLGDYHTAAKWYALVMELEESQPEDRLHYGFCLLRTGDCEAAGKWFKTYLSMRPYDGRKQALQNVCEHLEALRKNPATVMVQPVDFNTVGQDLAPAFFRDGLVYTSASRSAKDKQTYAGLFFAPRIPGDSLSFGAPQPFSGNLDLAFHEGVATFNPDQNEVYFTRTRNTGHKEHRLRLEISLARLLPQGKWSALEPLSFSSDDYSVAHPSVSADGERLFFSSDMPGGQGGKDIYMSVRVNGSWSKPLNLGRPINTEGDEVFPYIALDGSLYFSSDAHVGLGGQDIYQVKENTSGLWATPVNLGAPFNTAADDFAFIVDSTGQKGYFTSNRPEGPGGDDIYYFERTGRPIQVEILALADGKPLSKALLRVDRQSDTIVVDDLGKTFIRLESCALLTAYKDGFRPKTVEVCPHEMNQLADTLVVVLALEQLRPFSVSGVVFDQLSGEPMEGATVRLEGGACSEQLAVSTNEKGQFSFDPSTACCFQLSVALDEYTLQGEQSVCLNGVEPQAFINLFMQRQTPPAPEKPADSYDSDVFAGFERSAETIYDSTTLIYRLNVYYDVGRSSVQSNSVSELIKLRELLLRNPDLRVAIHSHTDSEGDANSNLRLSQRRADKIIRYLIGQGVERDRLEARGFGESRLVNDCTDAVPCTEEEHQQNRRTEFVVLD